MDKKEILLEEFYKEWNRRKNKGECSAFNWVERSTIKIFLEWLIEKDMVKSLWKEKAPQKPPLGVAPRFIWIEQRIKEINEAINNRIKAGMFDKTVEDWYFEIGCLMKELLRIRQQPAKGPY